mmetsp:Transcript_5580/g.12692  ORF Transcript_5580/g.12692 Transcript_5580/m.12692 type:complete len:288 (-) Transcript_5580:252-1115(-)
MTPAQPSGRQLRQGLLQGRLHNVLPGVRHALQLLEGLGAHHKRGLALADHLNVIERKLKTVRSADVVEGLFSALQDDIHAGGGHGRQGALDEIDDLALRDLGHCRDLPADAGLLQHRLLHLGHKVLQAEPLDLDVELAAKLAKLEHAHKRGQQLRLQGILQGASLLLGIGHSQERQRPEKVAVAPSLRIRETFLQLGHCGALSSATQALENHHAPLAGRIAEGSLNLAGDRIRGLPRHANGALALDRDLGREHTLCNGEVDALLQFFAVLIIAGDDVLRQLRGELQE